MRRVSTLSRGCDTEEETYGIVFLFRRLDDTCRKPDRRTAFAAYVDQDLLASLSDTVTSSSATQQRKGSTTTYRELIIPRLVAMLRALKSSCDDLCDGLKSPDRHFRMCYGGLDTLRGEWGGMSDDQAFEQMVLYICSHGSEE